MAVYVSSSALGHGRGVKEAVAELAGAGIDRIELSSSHRHEDGILSFLRKARARFLVHNYFPPPQEPFIFNLSSPEASVRRRSIELASEAVALCAELGCETYTIHGGYLSDPTLAFGFEQGTSLAHEKGLAVFFESLRELCREAYRVGVGVAVENNPCMPGVEGTLLFDDRSDFDAMFAEGALEEASVLLDVGHLKVSSAVLGFDADDFVEAVRPRVKLLHVNTNDGLVDSHSPFEEDDWCLDLITRHGLQDIDMVVEVLSDDIDTVKSCQAVLAQIAGSG